MPGREIARAANGLASEKTKCGPTEAAEPEGQALFDMANLRPERTGLPFVVFISQRGGARHDVRVKVAPGPRVRPSEMVTVSVRPDVRVMRGKLDPAELVLLRRWIELNREALIKYRDGEIAYTEDAIAALRLLDSDAG
jgi:hypothetical protein